MQVLNIAVALLVWLWISFMMAYASMKWQHAFGQWFNRINQFEEGEYGNRNTEWFSQEEPKFTGRNLIIRMLSWPLMLAFWSLYVAMNFLAYAMEFIYKHVLVKVLRFADWVVRSLFPSNFREESRDE